MTLFRKAPVYKRTWIEEPAWIEFGYDKALFTLLGMPGGCIVLQNHWSASKRPCRGPFQELFRRIHNSPLAQAKLFCKHLAGVSQTLAISIWITHAPESHLDIYLSFGKQRIIHQHP